MMAPRTRSFTARCVLTGTAIFLALGLAGCYERVIRAKGWRAGQYKIEEPDAPTDAEIAERKRREEQARLFPNTATK